ncbi:MAG: cytochrome C oxidase subunit IV family protein [Limnochordales bacterium]|nr:cytochrome C oxidase subunit IV family protein [Limnochordales bacterium]
MGKAQQAGAQPTTRDYLKVGVILFVLTVAEVVAIYIEALKPVLAAVLVLLSAWKFLLVAQVFMHLKYDSRVYAGFFAVGVTLAILITLAVTVIIL